MYSFYGGRPGNSFIIITTYRSIADMVAKFKQGPSYTAVHYDEHVMINTVNKNDPDNGRVYRRGYDFTNTMGGAEYIGTIVGPAGKAPMLEMTTVADVRSKHASEGYDERFTSGQYSPTGGNLVPGKTGSGTFNDAITWACCSIRNENDEDATAYIGFTFPYTVIDYETSWIEPYVAGRYADTSSATRVDDETHPFFEKWHINVPKGVKGNAFMNLKVEAASTNVEEYTGQADDINHGRMILAYDYYNYDDYQNGAPVRLYLGDYNMIDNVSIDDEGTITIDYSHDDDSVWTKKIKWVKSVTLNTETGLLTVVYNHTTDANGNPTTYTTYLDWIDEVNVADDGTVTFGHTHEADTVFDKKIQWVTGVTINNDGTVTFTWNNGTADTVFSNIIQWISSVSLAADGTLTVGYNNGAADSVFSKAVKWITDVQIANDGTVTVSYNNDDPAYVASQRLKWINDITLTDNGTLTVSYNNNSADTVFANRIRWLTGATLTDNGTFTLSWNNGTEDTVYHLNWLTGISVNTNLEGQDEGTGNQKLHITWANGTTEDIGNPINYIINMAVNENNNHLLVRYSDPVRRAAGGITYNNIDGWTDLGQITQQYEYNTTASGDDSHAEGNGTTASGLRSHAEGFRTIASGDYSHAEGKGTTASGANSHAEGEGTTASGEESHAEGNNTTASGDDSHAEGVGTTASGAFSHAEGEGTTASGLRSHAEGNNTTASGDDSHAEGSETTASADSGAHAEGFRTIANGESSHAQNFGTVANKASQTAIGTYNVSDTSATTTHPSGSAEYGKYAFIIGNGTYGSRSNALTVDWSGNVSAAGQVKSKTETYGISLPSGVKASKFELVRNGGIAMLSIVNIQSLPAGDTTICTLRSGWRPSLDVLHTFNAPAASSSSSDIRVTITTAGALNIYNYGSAITSTSNKSLTFCYVLA